MRVDVTPRARGDLQAIADWIAADNPERAVTFIDEITARADGLGDWPARFAIFTRLTNPPTRSFVHHDYRVFY